MISKLTKAFVAKNSYRGASLILIITLVCSNILGLLRNRFLAQEIPQYHLDAYLAAFRVPDFLFNLLVLGAISAVFIPIFTQYIENDKLKTAWHITNSVINLILIGVVFISVILFFVMPYLMHWLVPGFDASQLSETVKLSRLLLLSPLFFGISYVFGGVLNSFRRFFAYSIAPLIYNVAIIISIFLFVPRFGIWGVGLGVIIGAFLHMFIQLPVVIKLGWRWQPVFDFKNHEVKTMGKLMIPRVVGLASAQIVLIVFTFIASRGIGNVTYFSFANDIQTFFSVVFGSSFAVAIFPILSKFAFKDQNKFFENLRVCFKQILYFTLPFVILIIMLRAEIVRLLLGTGFYNWNATVITANALGAFAVGIWAASLVQLMARAYYAEKDTLRPTIISVVCALITIGLGFLFNSSNVSLLNMSVIGLAFAMSIGSILNFILLMIFLRNGRAFWTKELLFEIFKYLMAIIIIIFVTQGLKILFGNLVNMKTFLGVFLKTISTFVISLALYIFLTYIWGVREISAFVKIFKRKVSLKESGSEALEEQGKTES
jgi:putative peptidoglycan lipid II flippase